MAKKETLKDGFDKTWPKRKKQLEKAIKDAKGLLGKGEAYLKNISEKGVQEAKKISLGLKKEKFHYDLGKVVASTATTKWKDDKKINGLLKEIKKIEKQISEIK